MAWTVHVIIVQRFNRVFLMGTQLLWPSSPHRQRSSSMAFDLFWQPAPNRRVFLHIHLKHAHSALLTLQTSIEMRWGRWMCARQGVDMHSKKCRVVQRMWLNVLENHKMHAPIGRYICVCRAIESTSTPSTSATIFIGIFFRWCKIAAKWNRQVSMPLLHWCSAAACLRARCVTLLDWNLSFDCW